MAILKGSGIIIARIEKIRRLWNQLYSDERIFAELAEILEEAELKYKTELKTGTAENKNWYANAVVYSVYADLFNGNINGLTDRLDHIVELGANCIWLLPVLQSPMKDAGFDISDYMKIRDSLLENSEQNEFDVFLGKAHEKGIRIIFDIALNHCSDEHFWFKEALENPKGKYRDYFIWSDTEEKYSDARIIFKGLCDSNWQFEERSGQYYFHRFFPMQPDLNYKNPEVFLEMAKVMVFWKLKGLDGFRADAIPYLWKEEGTGCENLDKTHTVVKLFRAVLDYIDPDTLLLAEACQPPKKVVEYFGDGDECNGAYHFPVMPRIYMSMARQSNEAVKRIMSPGITPQTIPDNCQWFMFLRCHDELTLEMVSEEERKIIFDYYAKDPSWNFRQGEGISARLASLFSEDVKKIKLAYSIMFSLTGTPIIFYGDEFAKTNDVQFYEEQLAATGIDDSRYLVRGRLDWKKIEYELKKDGSISSEIFGFLKKIIKIRRSEKVFGNGKLRFEDFYGEKGNEMEEILGYRRTYGHEEVFVINNLSDKQLKFKPGSDINTGEDLLGKKILCGEDGFFEIDPMDFYWIKIDTGD